MLYTDQKGKTYEPLYRKHLLEDANEIEFLAIDKKTIKDPLKKKLIKEL